MTTNQPKDYTLHLIVGLFLFCALVSYPGCYNGELYSSNSTNTTDSTNLPHTYETDDVTFYDGEVLYPDYVIQDTLVVVNAKFINWAMEHYDAGSDGDIADILYAGCKRYGE